jgi:hypothetical protein
MPSEYITYHHSICSLNTKNTCEYFNTVDIWFKENTLYNYNDFFDFQIMIPLLKISVKKAEKKLKFLTELFGSCKKGGGIAKWDKKTKKQITTHEKWIWKIPQDRLEEAITFLEKKPGC